MQRLLSWRRSGAVVALVAAVGLLVSLVVPSADGLVAMTSEEHTFGVWINAARADMGVAPLKLDGHLTDQAQLHADRLASCECLYHSPDQEMWWWLGRGWWMVGENVAYADQPWHAHQALLESPSHRRALLNPRYRAYGVAVRRGASGRVYVVEWFGQCECPWA